MEFFGVWVYFGERGVKFSSDFVYIHDFHIIYNFGCVQFLFLYLGASGPQPSGFWFGRNKPMIYIKMLVLEL